MINCGNCKHWAPPTVKADGNLGTCELLSQDNSQPISLAKCFGGEGADLACTAEFGCVLGETKA